MPTDTDSIDWSPTTAQKVGAGVGLAIGLLSLTQEDLPAWVRVAFPIAYAAACAVIPRMRGVVRHRRTLQFAAHQAAMAVIAIGWWANDDVSSAAFNGAWFVSAGLWWVLERARS